MSAEDFFGFEGPPADAGAAPGADPFAEPEEVDDGVAAFSITDAPSDDVFARVSKSPSIRLDAPSLPDDIFSPSNTSQEPEHSDEQTPLSIWQAKRRQELDQKREKEKSDKADLLEQAKADIKTFLDNRAKATEKKQNDNRAAEKEFRNDMESVMKNGTLWEQVAKLVDLKPKAGKEEQITGRMRSLLLQLKNQKNVPGVKV